LAIIRNTSAKYLRSMQTVRRQNISINVMTTLFFKQT
jgi:hypothetical protein